MFVFYGDELCVYEGIFGLVECFVVGVLYEYYCFF